MEVNCIINSFYYHVCRSLERLCCIINKMDHDISIVMSNMVMMMMMEWMDEALDIQTPLTNFIIWGNLFDLDPIKYMTRYTWYKSQNGINVVQRKKNTS